MQLAFSLSEHVDLNTKVRAVDCMLHLLVYVLSGGGDWDTHMMYEHC